MLYPLKINVRSSAMVRCAALIFLTGLTVSASTPSYWFQQLQTKPDAQQAQQFWFVPGVGVVFTYKTNHVIINANSTNGFVDASVTNGLVGFGTVQGMTNGFVDHTVTNGLVGFGTVQGMTNGFVDQSVTNGLGGGDVVKAYTNIFTATNVFKRDSAGTTITPIVWLTNSTAAALGAQQVSPALMFGGQGWRSGTSATMPVQMGMYVLPVQGSAANPTAQLQLFQSIAGGAPAPAGAGTYFDSAGRIFAGFSLVMNDGSSPLSWSARSQIQSPVNSDLQLMNSASTSFNKLIFGMANGNFLSLKIEGSNSPAFSIRNATDTQYASLVESNNTAIGSSFVAMSQNGNVNASNNCPMGKWGFLSVSNAATKHILTPLSGAGVYTTITNYDIIYTNGFTGAVKNTTFGGLTNVNAGWYRISFSITCLTGNSDQVEADIAINGQEDDEIAAHTSTTNPAKDVTMSSTGIRYLPAGTGVTIKAQNLNSTTLSIAHAQLTIGSP